MDYGPMVAGTLGMLSLGGALIGVYVKANEKILLARQANMYTQKQVEKLERRVEQLEDKIFDKLDQMQKSIEDLKIEIAQKL